MSSFPVRLQRLEVFLQILKGSSILSPAVVLYVRQELWPSVSRPSYSTLP